MYPYIGKVNTTRQGSCRNNCGLLGSEESVDLLLLVQTFAVVARKTGAFGEVVHIAFGPGKDNHFFAKGQTLKVLVDDLDLTFVSGLAGSEISYLIGD